MEENIKCSLISTVKNEEKSIAAFLDSLLAQTKKPFEVLFVDGGSVDKTVSIIESYRERIPGLKVIVSQGANRGKGRNVAISHTGGNIIVSSDAGCLLERKWFEEITKPFEGGDVDAVAGWYVPENKTNFEEAQSDILIVQKQEVEKNINSFLPSARSLAFKKSLWEKVGGFPEGTIDDTFFDLRLKEAGVNFYFAPKAVVHWEPRSSIAGLYKQLFEYAKGAGELLLFRGYIIKVLLFLFEASVLILSFHYPLLWAISIPMPFFYLLYLKLIRKKNMHILRVHYYFIIEIVSGVATFFGWVVGVLNFKKL